MCCLPSAADRSGPAPPFRRGHRQPRKIAPATLPPTYSGYFTRPGEVVATRDLSVYQRIGQAKARETHI